MKMRSMSSFVNELNEEAVNYKIGNLQEIRTRIKGFIRQPYSKIFHERSTFDTYAIHYGGRKELQFNIGYDEYEGRKIFRYGVAFSLETSRSLPDVSLLYPKIIRYNGYITYYPELFKDYSFWYWEDDTDRSENMEVTTISKDLAHPKMFIFIGKFKFNDQVSSREILETFDELLPLYEYVENKNAEL